MAEEQKKGRKTVFVRIIVMCGERRRETRKGRRFGPDQRDDNLFNGLLVDDKSQIEENSFKDYFQQISIDSERSFKRRSIESLFFTRERFGVFFKSSSPLKDYLITRD